MHTRTLTKSKLDSIDTVFLCGGMGTRLRTVVNDRPKPMAEIVDRPFLDILIDSFSRFGLRRFILCAGYMSDIIDDYYTEQNNPRELVISTEHHPLGTAGAIRNAAEYIQSENFLVANGDSICSVNLDEFYDFHITMRALMSMVVIDALNTRDCGLVSVDESQRITGFEEKKQRSGSGYINAGIYLFRNDVLSLIPDNIKFSLERELFPRLIEENCYAFPIEGRLFDIGTPERLAAAIQHLAKDQLRSHINHISK